MRQATIHKFDGLVMNNAYNERFLLAVKVFARILDVYPHDL